MTYSCGCGRAPLYNVDRLLFLACPLRALPAAGARHGERAAVRRLRARLQPRLELRPLAARPAALAEAALALHGEVGALLVAADGSILDGARCVSGSPRPARRRGDRDRRAARARGQPVAMFPEGTRRTKGLVKSSRRARAPAPRGSRSRPASRSCRPPSRGTDRLLAPRAAARRVRGAGRDRRPARQRDSARPRRRRPSG